MRSDDLELKVSHFGIWDLTEEIFCQKELSFKEVRTKIGGKEIDFCFPSILIGDDNGTLKMNEKPWFPFGNNNADWGTIYNTKNGHYGVRKLFGNIKEHDEESIQMIYDKFPAWERKFKALLRLLDGEHKTPPPPVLRALQNIGPYDGLQIYQMTTEKSCQVVSNKEPIRVDIHLHADSLFHSYEEIKKLFKLAGIDSPLSLPYELLVEAFLALDNKEYRSSILLGSIAVEQILEKVVRQYYQNNKILDFKNDLADHQGIDRKFQLLKKLKIKRPLENYKDTITKPRNNIAHVGVKSSYKEANEYLQHCKLILNYYHPGILESEPIYYEMIGV